MRCGRSGTAGPTHRRGPGPPGPCIAAVPGPPGPRTAADPPPGHAPPQARACPALAILRRGRFHCPAAAPCAGFCSSACADKANPPAGNHWKDDPGSAGRVHSCKTPFGRAGRTPIGCSAAPERFKAHSRAEAPTRPILLTGFSRPVLLQIRKIATILRRIAGAPNRACSALSRGLDHIAIGPPRHHAVLHLAGSGEIAREPHADREQDDGDDQAGDRAAPVVALLCRDWAWRVLRDYGSGEPPSSTRRAAGVTPAVPSRSEARGWIVRLGVG